MDAVRKFVSQYELTVFFLLNYAISWSIVFPMNGALLPQGPALAAIIVLAIVAGRRGLADWWQQVSRWRVDWIWYLIAPGLVLGYSFAAVIVNLLLGATITAANYPSTVPAILTTLVMLLIFGGEWEEPGWSAYALPRFLEWFKNRPAGPLLGVLALGVFRALWHLPLVLHHGAMPWFDLVFFTFAFQILIAWLYIRTNRSVLIVMWFHFTSNLVGGFVNPLFNGADHTRYYVLFIVFAWLAVFVLIRLQGTSLGWKTGE